MTEGTKKPQPESNDLKARLGIKSSSPPSVGPTREPAETGPVNSDPFAMQPGTGGIGWQPPPPGKPDVQAPDLSSSRRWIWVGLFVVALAAFGVGALFGNVSDQRSRRRDSTQQAKQLLQETKTQGEQIDYVHNLVTTIQRQLGNPAAATVKSTKELLAQLKDYKWEKLDNSKNNTFTRITQTDFGSPLVRTFHDYHLALREWQRLVKEFAGRMESNVDTLAERSVLLKNGDNLFTQVDKSKVTEKFGLLLTSMGIPNGSSVRFPQAKLVEITGNVACKEGKKPKDKPCALEDMEVPFRIDLGGKEEKRPMIFQEGGIVQLLPNLLLRRLMVTLPQQAAYDKYKRLEGEMILAFEELRESRHRLQRKLEERSQTTTPPESTVSS